MKDKSFILRSSRITSKTYSTITPSYQQLGQQSFINLSRKRDLYFPSLQQSSHQSSTNDLQRDLQIKDKQLKQRLNKLNSNLKTLQKHYKQNLKDGFQNKIKSYRLQAVMERKMLKQTIDQTLKLNQLQDLKQKHSLALKQKQQNELNLLKQQQKRQKLIQNIKNEYKIKKRQNNHSISNRINELQNRNKSLHDRIISQQKYKDRKRNYLQYWKQQKLKKDEFDMKKDMLQRIINNTRRIKGLHEELSVIQDRCQKLRQITGQNIRSSPIVQQSALFVTI